MAIRTSGNAGNEIQMEGLHRIFQGELLDVPSNLGFARRDVRCPSHLGWLEQPDSHGHRLQSQVRDAQDIRCVP